ncbi:hypothetical protein FRB96_003928 [Tulasnella sp. 330]|nr:hypothetical protein FRB96_003928 [Tulasnella sp. 330]KAG8876483.1 hypothetical protein FRB97_004144 [Tulasnella sp. 331]
MSSTAVPSSLDRLGKNVAQKVTAAPTQLQTTPVTVSLPATCPDGFTSAPERVQAASFVKDAVKCINDMLNLLNHPESGSEYSDLQRVSYRAHDAIAVENLKTASMIVSAWSASVVHHIDDINRELLNIQTVEMALHERMKGHTQSVHNVATRIGDATRHLTHESDLLDQAQDRFAADQKKYADAVKARDQIAFVSWVPVAATALHVIANATTLQQDVAHDVETVSAERQRVSEDQRTFEKLQQTLKGLQSEGFELNAQVTAVQVKKRELDSQKGKLNDDLKYLDPVAANIHDSCIPITTAAFVETKGTSVKSVAEAFKIVLGALKEESGLTGDLATLLDDHKAAEAQKKIAVLLKDKPLPSKPTANGHPTA